MRKRAALLAHIQNTNSQYNLPEIGKKLASKANREGVAEHCPDPSVRKALELDLALIDPYDPLLREVELSLTRTAKGPAAQRFARVQSVPGIGQSLALVLLYEIQAIARFPRVQDFVSYCRRVKCAKESAGKRHGRSGQKSGNPQLTGACSEAAVLSLRQNKLGQDSFARLERQHGKGQALPGLAQQFAPAVYSRFRREHALAVKRFVTA